MSARRELVLQVSGISLDGIVCEESTQFDNWARTIRDPNRDQWMLASVNRAGVHIMGRTTYLSMAAHWPTADEIFAEPMNRTPKVVFSKSLTTADWPESRIASGDTAAEVAALKAEPGAEVMAHGGARFSQSLASHNLVDEYRLIVYPYLAGQGLRLFDHPHESALNLESVTAFPSGCMALVYRREP